MSYKIPRHLEENILQEIKAKLSPSYKIIFSKMILIHFFSALLTLAICPQFGVSSYESKINLMNFFMQFGGKPFCDFACGIFFMSITLFLISLIFNADERRVFKGHVFLNLFALILISLGGFFIMNSNLFFELSILWIFGAIIGGLLAFFTGHQIRTHHFRITQ